jgi:hypothetical protein
MVTARQIGRGLSRTVRAMERDAARVQRQRIVYQKAVAKQAMLDAAADAAHAYDDLIIRLTGAHRTAFQRIDWSALALAERPEDAARSSAHEDAAARALAQYRPGWFARLFGLQGARRKLEATVARGRARDEEAHAQAVEAIEARPEPTLQRRSGPRHGGRTGAGRPANAVGELAAVRQGFRQAACPGQGV